MRMMLCRYWQNFGLAGWLRWPIREVLIGMRMQRTRTKKVDALADEAAGADWASPVKTVTSVKKSRLRLELLSLCPTCYAEKDDEEGMLNALLQLVLVDCAVNGSALDCSLDRSVRLHEETKRNSKKSCRSTNHCLTNINYSASPA